MVVSAPLLSRPLQSHARAARHRGLLSRQGTEYSFAVFQAIGVGVFGSQAIINSYGTTLRCVGYTPNDGIVYIDTSRHMPATVNIE